MARRTCFWAYFATCDWGDPAIQPLVLLDYSAGHLADGMIAGVFDRLKELHQLIVCNYVSCWVPTALVQQVQRIRAVWGSASSNCGSASGRRPRGEACRCARCTTPARRCQVDHAGDTVSVMDDGTARAAQIFVAYLSCSGLIYAEASWTRRRRTGLAPMSVCLPSWAACRRRLYQTI
jgi:hypothetical protein